MSDIRERKRIRVVDVPSAVTPEKAEQLLNDVCEQGYYVLALLPGAFSSTRAFLGKRRAPKVHSGRDHKQEHDKALAIIRAHPNESIRSLIELLRQAGIKRSKTWVSDTRMALKGGGSKLSEMSPDS